MSEERRKQNKPATGTVPKTKYRTNSSNHNQQQQRNMTNNLQASSEGRAADYAHFIRNPRRSNCYAMDALAMEDLPNGGYAPNSTAAPASRRTSSALKCDNIAKYPGRKQIEDKLSQIREYLRITTSLMSAMKTTDDQPSDEAEGDNLSKMIRDLRDSESKLVEILNALQDDDEEETVQIVELSDHSESGKNDNLDEQMALLHLKQKAENKLRDARLAQERLLHQQNQPHRLDRSEARADDFDDQIKLLEERAKRLNPNKSTQNAPSKQFQDKFMADVDSLQKEIFGLHNANEERAELIQVLDNRDAELRTQHTELQNKLKDLQSKKQQVDQLVAQLQTLDGQEEEQQDLGGQVRNICTMKDQLHKLKDMLEIVKNTESAVLNCNDSQEANALAGDICERAENFLLNDFQTRNDLQAAAAPSFSHGKQKLVNKPQRQRINELEAKKRELEDLMGKHKAATSNVNNDVGVDSKSEHSCHTSLNEQWVGQFSSDDEAEMPEYTQTSSIPIRTSQSRQARPRSNMDRDRHQQLNKQLQLIKSVCDSMLEQQQLQQYPATNNCTSNVQVRNNLTPSPVYMETQPLLPHQQQQQQQQMIPNEASWQHGPDPNYQTWLATNTLQTQSFMLNTLNQCCQMLWLQQRELQNLRGAVSMMQDRMDNGVNVAHEHQYAPTMHNHQHQATPPGSYRPAPSPKIHVANACSMPNLNHYNSVLPPSNADYQQHNSRVLDHACLNNGTSSAATNSAAVLHGVNHANINNVAAQPLWNGQALNNQVAPGNRANNYWDNFRSYSRQNQLTKNVESPFDRSNSAHERTNPFTLMALSKSNSEHESTSTETTPQRRLPPFRHNETAQPVTSTSTVGGASVTPPPVAQVTTTVPPDVLNVNCQISSMGKFGEMGTPPAAHEPIDDLQLGFQMLLNTAYNDASSNHSNASNEERLEGGARRRNDWTNDTSSNKTKLFEELRESVYKEVASLISANEARPHFLIQLFRDLQMIGSDSLRLKILQSIQSVVTHSMAANPSPSQSNANEEYSLQSTVWSKARKSSLPRSGINTEIESDIESALKDVMQFINDNNDTIIDQDFSHLFKQRLLESKTFGEAHLDSVFQKHFLNVLNELLDQFQGRKLHDVKIQLLHSIGDLLEGELSFIHLIQETSPENCDNLMQFNKQPIFNLPGSSSPQLHNGDLAEADQTLGEEDEAEEEEGAVGGYLELVPDTSDFQVVDDLDPSSMDFSANGEGLDQVPTRLPTTARSRSTTPSRGLSD